MAQPTIKLKGMESFHEQNPGFDILKFDFHDKKAVKKLTLGETVQPEVMEELKTNQRLLRIHPDQKVANKLRAKGLDSAHAITAIPEFQFVREHADAFNGDKDLAQKAYKRAVHIKTGVKQLYAYVKDMVASPYYRATLFYNTDEELSEYYKNIPSYHELFGSLDYLECEHCQSIFGQSAYFLDIMRITDQYITYPNTEPVNTIPTGYKLEERRPDLFDLPLICENITTVISYLEVVNNILKSYIEKRLKIDDAFKSLALAGYPFNLPFNLPLTQLRLYLENLKTSLDSVYRDFVISDGNPEHVQEIDVAREFLGLSIEEYKIITTPGSTKESLNRFYGYNDITKHLPFSGTGTIAFTMDEKTVNGTGTKFMSELKKGDQIRAADNTRTVVNITSDTELTVEYNWPLTTSGASFEILPQDGLDVVSAFLERTRISYTQLVNLFTQDLSKEELTAGVADSFFINKTGDDLEYLQIYWDKTDPGNHVQRIRGLSRKRLDRLNRFIRLAGIIGWSYKDLQWALEAYGKDCEITSQVVEYLSKLQKSLETTEMSLELLSSFWHDIKTIGKKDDKNPQDFFDRIFNNPALLDGQDPYKSNTVPFDPWRDPIQKWKIADTTGQNMVIRSRLCAALMVNDKDLTTIATYLLTMKYPESSSTDTLDLNLVNLTWLYRLSKLPAILELTIDEYLNLLCLIYYQDQPYLSPPKDAVPATIDDLIKIKNTADWLSNSHLTVYQLRYVITGKVSDFFNPGYKDEDIKPFINSLSTMAEGSYLKPDALVFEDVDSDQAGVIIDNLVKESMITKIGVFLKIPDGYNDVAPLFPIRFEEYSKTWILGFDQKSFITKSITGAESEEVFEALKNHTPPIILIPEGKSTGELSSDFNEMTDLSFLKPIFTGENSEFKVSEVRALLLQTKRNISHTADVLKYTEELQESNLLNGLSDFLNSKNNSLAALLPFAANKSGLSNYLEAFLTPIPPNGKLPDNVPAFIKILSQWNVVVDNIPLTKTETEAIIKGPGHFNITDINNITIYNIQSISGFKSLDKDFRDTDDALISYFDLPKDTSPCPGAKVLALAKLTAWNADQICTLINLFWPVDSDTDYDTIAGIARLKRCFDTSFTMGVDIDFLLKLCSMSHLPISDGSNNLVPENWTTYVDIASLTLGVLNAKYGDTEFQEVYKSITDKLNTDKRNVLLPYTLWLINPINQAIKTPSDLYQYLLIDVEMGSCQVTSKIAQGIASVQLYMQRCRMGLEPGINSVEIPEIWWVWMSNYRIWEANRKIFLYPENYIEPSLRRSVTPEFKELSDSLLQTDITKDTVIGPYEQYFKNVTVLANLVHIASHHCKRIDPDTGEPMDTLFIFGRTNTEPYTYYYRTLDNYDSWTPWEKIDLSIAALTVTPIYCAGRLFIFWTEIDVSKSSTIKDQESNTQTVYQATIKYSFYRNKQWANPQVLLNDTVINVFPGNYPSIETDQIKNILDPDKFYWYEPYIFSSGSGITGKGRVVIVAGLGNVGGTNTNFKREVKEGDTIWCSGEGRTVKVIVNSTELLVDPPWSINAGNSEYRIIPNNIADRFEPYKGPGKVIIIKDLENVGGIDTNFLSDFSYGDKIAVDNETRIVYRIQSNTEMLVDRKWDEEHNKSEYTVIPTTNGSEQLIVMCSGKLDSPYSTQPQNPEPEPNPQKDTFIEQRNHFNDAMYDKLWFANQTDVPGYVTCGPATILDGNLIKEDTQLLIADYTYTDEKNPQPYKPGIDRNQSRLNIIQSNNALADNYWSNNLPGKLNPDQQYTGKFLNLLYYISERKALLINVNNQPGWFIFNNSNEAFLVKAQEENLNKLSDMVFIRSMPMLNMLNNQVISCGAYTSKPAGFDELKFKFTRLTTNTIETLNQLLFAGGIDKLLTIESQELPELPFKRFFPAPGTTPPSAVIPPETDNMDFDGAFGLYFWEIFFHSPFLIADRLNQNNRYKEARLWLQYIFNPTQKPGQGDVSKPGNRFWEFLPFRTMNKETLTEILKNERQIWSYNYYPFDPDAIAKYRTVAYAKAVVMKYIDNLLDWGDKLFALDTREAVNEATNLYVMASDLLGKRPESKGKIPSPTPKTFREIKEDYKGNIPQFFIELENTPGVFLDGENIQYLDVPFNDINSYFCVPENSDFIKYWDRVEDRLYKIRHCMNIEGVVRRLPLFEPPVDPRALIRAAAAGGPGMSLASRLDAPIPYFRFDYMIEKAKMLTSQLSNLGTSLLSTLEKKDAEELSLLRIRQEKNILNLTTNIKKQQIQEVKENRASIEESLNSANYRKTHYTDLLKKPVSAKEQMSLDAMAAAVVFNTLGSITKTAASIGYAVPQVGSPFAMTYGGVQIGNALNAASGVFEIGAIIYNFISQQALTMAGYDRRKEDWTLQQKLAEFDVEQVTDQLTANDIRQQISELELKIHEEIIKQNEEMEFFLKDKFTNKELYQWMIGRISTVYFQTYSLAFDMARAAQRAFQYEFDTDQSFINFGYWDDLHKGLGAAEGLMLALSQMEKASMDKSKRYLEIEKSISLMQLNPKALLDLKNTGECTFEFTEKLFDYDFPGHYCRKIKTISISIPAVIGPYQNIKATLTQLSNQTIVKPEVDAVNFLLGGKDAKDPTTEVLRSNWWVNQQIAISNGVNDSGMFELNFHDNRYLPFEGTGAVSTWRLSMPFKTNQINFETISDVIITLRYTAVNGGSKFRDDVSKLPSLKPFIGVEYLSMNQRYSSQWHAFLHDHTSKDSQELSFDLANFIPPHVDSNEAKLFAFYFRLDTGTSVPGSYIKFQVTDAVAIEINLDSDNKCFYNFKTNGKQEPKLKDIFGKRTIAFDLNTTPGALKKGDFLDTEVVGNIEIILYYEGGVDMVE